MRSARWTSCAGARRRKKDGDDGGMPRPLLKMGRSGVRGAFSFEGEGIHAPEAAAQAAPVQNGTRATAVVPSATPVESADSRFVPCDSPVAAAVRLVVPAARPVVPAVSAVLPAVSPVVPAARPVVPIVNPVVPAVSAVVPAASCSKFPPQPVHYQWFVIHRRPNRVFPPDFASSLRIPFHILLSKPSRDGCPGMACFFSAMLARAYLE